MQLYTSVKYYETQKDQHRQEIENFGAPSSDSACIYYHAFLVINTQGHHLEMII